MPLEGPDQLHLRATAGYIELGLFEEANAELEEIDPFCRHLPEVLAARLAIYHGLKEIAALTTALKAQTAQIQKVSDQLAAERPAPRIVANN